jgi:hypothetical protein
VDAVATKLAALPPLGLAAIKEMIRSSGNTASMRSSNASAGTMRRLGFTEDYRRGRRRLPRKEAAQLHRPLKLQLSAPLLVTPPE